MVLWFGLFATAFAAGNNSASLGGSATEALRFSGDNLFTDEFTIEFWIDPNDATNRTTINVIHPLTSLEAMVLTLRTSSGDPQWELEFNDTTVGDTDICSLDLFTSACLPLDDVEIHHVAITGDATGYKFYVDNTLLDEDIWGLSGAPDFDATNFVFGADSDTAPVTTYNDEMFKGDVDEIRIWDEALSAETLTCLSSNSLSGTERGLTHWWPITNAPNGANVLDAVGTADADITGSKISLQQRTLVPDNVGLFACYDYDGDGSPRAEDCNDSNPAIFPEQAESLNGIDDNCNGFKDEASADADGDGIGDLTEQNFLTNPRLTDTDGDGISDTIEYGDDLQTPSNADSDILIDARDPDSDNDGHPDSEEGTGDADCNDVGAWRDDDEVGDINNPPPTCPEDTDSDTDIVDTDIIDTDETDTETDETDTDSPPDTDLPPDTDTGPGRFYVETDTDAQTAPAGCGCSSSATGGTPAAFLLAAAAFTRRRRQRR